MGRHKEELRQAYLDVKDADQSVGYPDWVFHALTKPFEHGAWDCPDSKAGKGAQCYLELVHLKTKIENGFSLADGDAASIYQRFPSDR